MKSKELGRTLKWWRKKRGFSLKKLASKSGLCYPTIARIEHNIRNPRRETLLALCTILKIKMEDLDRTVEELEAACEAAKGEDTMERVKRQCKFKENFGTKLHGCLGEIDNGNYFYCSYCHTFVTEMATGLRDQPHYFEEVPFSELNDFEENIADEEEELC
jgi:transcriptional regulator with XRE-family HTH domain